jgi:hypothetical protein
MLNMLTEASGFRDENPGILCDGDCETRSKHPLAIAEIARDAGRLKKEASRLDTAGPAVVGWG